MRILYRRLSGTLGISAAEPGARGTWLEKRAALLTCLEARGHVVTVHGRISDASRDLLTACQWTGSALDPADVSALNEDFDMLLVEFGGTNMRFYGEQIRETCGLASAFRGPKVFLCDDPDLRFPWNLLGRLRAAEWKVWANCVLPRTYAEQYLQRPGDVPAQAWDVEVLDLPFASLCAATGWQHLPANDRLVYVGRPNGRVKAFRQLVAAGVWFQVYGRQKEWKLPGVAAVRAAPLQNERRQFYGQQLGALGIVDDRHKELGWRTGRIYHAGLAGCPVVVEADNRQMSGLGWPTYGHAGQVWDFISAAKQPEARQNMIDFAREIIEKEAVVADTTLRYCGL